MCVLENHPVATLLGNLRVSYKISRQYVKRMVIARVRTIHEVIHIPIQQSGNAAHLIRSPVSSRDVQWPPLIGARVAAKQFIVAESPGFRLPHQLSTTLNPPPNRRIETSSRVAYRRIEVMVGTSCSPSCYNWFHSANVNARYGSHGFDDVRTGRSDGLLVVYMRERRFEEGGERFWFIRCLC